jgi:Fic family protein
MGVFGYIFGYMDPKVQPNHEILQLVAELDEFKGKWTATTLLAPDRLQALRHVATIESIGSSTRIEGAKLSDAEVDALLSGVKTYSFRSRDEQEVAGYAEAMEFVFGNFADINLTENHIKQLHTTLLKYSNKDERHRGDYKKFPNHVEAFDADGKSLGVVFETTKPFDTPTRMQELVEWTNNVLAEKKLHPLLVISVFVVHFLAIHPFQDGNGRLSRILTTLLLLRAGYTYVPYSSFERVIEANKDGYYLALRRAQGTLNKDDSKLSEWLLFFLYCMQKQKSELEKKLERESLLEKLPELSAQILAFVKDRGRATISDIVNLTQDNRNTVKAHLKALVRTGRLSQQGVGKGTWYKIA